MFQTKGSYRIQNQISNPIGKGEAMKKYILIAGVVLGLAAAAFIVIEQSPLLAQEGPGGPGGQGRGGRFMPGGRGISSLAVLSNHLFAASENTLYKIDPETMMVVKTLELRTDSQEGK
jgi:hypothetical protein